MSLFVFVCFKNVFLKILLLFFLFSLLQINIFFMFLNYFDVLILKIIFKNKKYYFNTFLNKKYFF